MIMMIHTIQYLTRGNVFAYVLMIFSSVVQAWAMLGGLVGSKKSKSWKVGWKILLKH
jgi:hypothetical protein